MNNALSDRLEAEARRLAGEVRGGRFNSCPQHAREYLRGVAVRLLEMAEQMQAAEGQLASIRRTLGQDADDVLARARRGVAAA